MVLVGGCSAVECALNAAAFSGAQLERGMNSAAFDGKENAHHRLEGRHPAVSMG